MPKSGDIILNTGDIYSGNYREIVGRGDWHYAIYAQNRKGLLCPGAMQNYLTIDADIELLELTYIKSKAMAGT